MGSGLLTGRFSRERAAALEDGDWRRSSEEFTEPALSRNLELQDALRPIAERHRTTPAAVAVAWTLGWPGVSGAIVGARSPEQVDGWIGAADLTLDDEDRDALRAGVEATGAGAGPMAPGR
jgi:aryl-alcohol dehydrogenase-like predicted oxidoreductase